MPYFNSLLFRLLFVFICRAQDGRRISSDPKLETPQPLYSVRKVSHGDHTIRSPIFFSGGLAGTHRPQGRLPSRPNSCQPIDHIFGSPFKAGCIHSWPIISPNEMVASVGQELRRLDIQFIPYLEDWLIVAKSREIQTSISTRRQASC